MIYKYTFANILTLMQSVGELEEAQVVRFFANEATPIVVNSLLEQLIRRNILKYDPEKKLISYMGATKLRDEIAERRRYAFWCLVNLGSTNLNALSASYPVDLTFIDNKNQTYDVCVVENRDDAVAAAVFQEKSFVRGVVDDINHIAVLRRASDVKYLEGLGFDSYCTFDPKTKRAHYEYLDS